MVRASAPGKLMLFGDHAVVYGHPCIVTAVSKRIEVSVEEYEGDEVCIDTPGVSDHSFLHAVLSRVSSLWRLPRSIRITVHSSFSGAYGFGSSSAVTVALLKALSSYASIDLAERELFSLALDVVLSVQKVGSGFDVAAASFGRTLLYKNKGEIIEPVPWKDIRLIVGYTGVKANTVEIVREVAEKRNRHPEQIDSLFNRIGSIVWQAKQAMEENDMSRLGELMDEHHSLLQTLGVSSEKLDALVSAARKAGAFGAKPSGAGRGDCMIALASKETEEDVATAIRLTGGEVVSVAFHEEGARLEV